MLAEAWSYQTAEFCDGATALMRAGRGIRKTTFIKLQRARRWIWVAMGSFGNYFSASHGRGSDWGRVKEATAVDLRAGQK